MYVHVHVRKHLKDKFAEYVTSEIIAPKYVCSLYESDNSSFKAVYSIVIEIQYNLLDKSTAA